MSCASCIHISLSSLADSRPFFSCSEVNNMGLICHVDLFPVPGDSSDVSADSKRRQDQAQSSPGRASTSTLSPTPYSPGAQPYPYTYPAPQPPPPYSPQHGAPPGNIPSAHSSSISTQQPAQAQEHPYPPNQPPPSNPTRPEEIVHYFNGTFAISEGSKQTDALAGTTFVQAANLDYKGNKVLMFVFAVSLFSSFHAPFSHLWGADPLTLC